MQNALAVKTYLQGKRIHVDRIITAGIGTEKPTADYTTPTGRQQHRFVVVYATGN